MKLFAMTATLVMLLLAGCGTDNPFDRGNDFGNDVVDPGQNSDISFTATVKPILQVCQGCHGGGSNGWTYGGAHDEVFSVVDITDPEGSSLVVKATGGASHGGGTVISKNSDAYNALLIWIQEGAKDN